MRTILVILALLSMTAFVRAESPKPGVHPMKYVSELDGSEQPYNLFVPTAAGDEEPVPLVVVLHGKGATWESWFLATKVTEWAEGEGYAVVAPQGRGDWFYKGAGERDVMDVIAEAKKLLPIDEDRIYLVGHSMGGWGTWRLGCAHPDLFAAIVPMSGWAPQALLGNLEYTPPLAIHGDSDEVVEPENTRRAISQLGLLGVNHRFIETRGYGHESAMISDMLPEIGAWLREHTRVTDPKELNLSTYTPLRAWWIEIRQIEQPLKLASVKAKADPPTLTIETENVKALTVDFASLAVEEPLKVIINGSIIPSGHLTDEKLHVVWMGSNWQRVTEIEDADDVLFAVEDTIEDFPQIIADTVLKASVADVVLIPHDLLAPELLSKTVTINTIEDLFFSPDDELVRLKLNRHQYQEVLSKPEWLPRWWGDLVVAKTPKAEKKSTINVLVPAAMAVRMPLEKEHTGRFLRRVLYDHLKKEKRF